MATGDLNEYKIHELMAARAPIDVFGVGTELAPSADAPSLGVIYKMVEMEDARGRRYPIKNAGISTPCRAPSKYSGTRITICWRVRASAPPAPAARPKAPSASKLC